MPFAEQFERLAASLGALGARRLAALALTAVAIVAAVVVLSWYLARPGYETLYTGLDRQDVGRIGQALGEAGIAFDVSADGAAVLVPVGDTARARMLLAEQGLPRSASSGYELFDNMGSIGLTSFMQEVTRVRALEGEIARTLQAIAGVKAARVHIVLDDAGNFRRAARRPSASVLLRTEGVDAETLAQAVRHLVAAAVPGMTAEEVTILNADGSLLASGADGATASPGRLAALERSVSGDIEDKVRRTLMPYLGLGNFQVSAVASLNADRSEQTETQFDPESRVERSVRTVREEGQSQNNAGNPAVTVEQNLPDQAAGQAAGDTSSEQNSRREETTNYEINTKTIQTVRDGFTVEKLAVAVVVDEARLVASLGENPPENARAERLVEIERLVSTSAGVNGDRGDTVAVTALPFVDGAGLLQPVPGLTIVEQLSRHAGGAINALTLLAAVALLIWFGLRPATRAILEANVAGRLAAPAAPQLQAAGAAAAAGEPENGEDDLTGDVPQRMKRLPQKRLEQIVKLDTEQAAAVIRQWVRQDQPG
jgi:flagellar M-ring protein FliF